MKMRRLSNFRGISSANRWYSGLDISPWGSGVWRERSGHFVDGSASIWPGLMYALILAMHRPSVSYSKMVPEEA